MTTADKNRKNGWFGLILVVLCWLLIFSLAKDFNKVVSGFKRIDETGVRLKDVQAQNQELKKKLVSVQTDYYKEKVIREKLNMQRPGETVVVLADKTTDKENTVQAENEASTIPVWQRWWSLVR